MSHYLHLIEHAISVQPEWLSNLLEFLGSPYWHSQGGCIVKQQQAYSIHPVLSCSCILHRLHHHSTWSKWMYMLYCVFFIDAYTFAFHHEIQLLIFHIRFHKYRADISFLPQFVSLPSILIRFRCIPFLWHCR